MESPIVPVHLQPTASRLVGPKTMAVMPGAETRSSRSILLLIRLPPRNTELSLTTNGTTKTPHTTASRRGTETLTRQVPPLTVMPLPSLLPPTVKVHTDTVPIRLQAPTVLPPLNTATTLGLRMLLAKTALPDMASLTIPFLPRTTTTRATLAKSMLLTSNGLSIWMMNLRMKTTIMTPVHQSPTAASPPIRLPPTRLPPTKPPPATLESTDLSFCELP